MMGALGGVGNALVAQGERIGKQEDADLQMERDKKLQAWLMQAREEYTVKAEGRAEERTIAGEKRKVAAEDKARTDRVSRIDAKAGELADTAVAEKRGMIDSGIADRESWTPEQQAAVDQSLGRDRKALADDPETKIKASIATGDIAPEKAATIHREDRRLDATERATAAKERAAEMRDATQRYIADLKHEDSQKRLDVLIAKIGAKDGKDGTTEALKFIDGARKELANDEHSLRSLYQAELNADKFMEPAEKARIKAEYEPKFAAIQRKRTQVEKDFAALRGKVGLPASEPEPTPAPKPAPANRPPLSTFQKK
jgi:hypothetical protein